jgi:hypothetical protein
MESEVTKKVDRPMSWLAVLCSLLLVLSGLVVSGQATAAPAAVSSTASDPVPGGFASWSDLFAVQQRLNRAADEIEGVASMVAPDGLGGFWAAPDRRELVVYWRGAVPAAVERAIAAHRADVPIKVISARYTRRQLLAEVRRIAAQSKATGLAYSKIYPKPDGSGVGLVLIGKASAAVDAKRTRALAERTVDVEVRYGGTRAKLFSRENDSSPYYAGARTNNCTLGFAVRHQNANRLLSAAHCETGFGEEVHEDPDHNGGSFVEIGLVVAHNVGRDIMVINAASAGRMWDGGNLSTFAKPVRGATKSRFGNFVCVSGSRSGVWCGAQVKLTDTVEWGFAPVVEAIHPHGQQVAGEGDSGGPVFELPVPDDGSVIAKGLVSGPLEGTGANCVIGERGGNPPVSAHTPSSTRTWCKRWSISAPRS